MNSGPIVETRIAKIEKDQEKRKASVPGKDWHEFRVAPSCPPDKCIHMRGGLCYHMPEPGGGITGRAWTVPDRVADFSDEDSVGIDITFTNANYYLGYMLTLDVPTDYTSPAEDTWNFILVGSGTEFEEAADAEEDLLEYIEDTFQAWDAAMPLCGVVLKNDGTTGAGAHILSIERLNRGRSYIWPSDLRPRLITL